MEGLVVLLETVMTRLSAGQEGACARPARMSVITVTNPT